MFQILYSASEAVIPSAGPAVSTPPSLFWTIIASAFGGALITSAVTVWAKFTDSKTERYKWFREEKLATYVEFNRVSEHIYYSVSQKLSNEGFADFIRDMLNVMARVELLASAEVSKQCRKVRACVSAGRSTAEWEKYREESKKLLELMRSDLLANKNMKH